MSNAIDKMLTSMPQCELYQEDLEQHAIAFLQTCHPKFTPSCCCLEGRGTYTEDRGFYINNSRGLSTSAALSLPEECKIFKGQKALQRRTTSRSMYIPPKACSMIGRSASPKAYQITSPQKDFTCNCQSSACFSMKYVLPLGSWLTFGNHTVVVFEGWQKPGVSLLYKIDSSLQVPKFVL